MSEPKNNISEDLKKALKEAIYDDYTDKNTHQSIKGIEGIAKTLVVKAIDKKDRENLNAIKYIFSLLGIENGKADDATEKEIQERIKAYKNLK